MAAKSGGDFWVDGCGGEPTGGNNPASSRASSQPSGSGQPTLATSARFKYSETVLTEIEQLRAICRWSSFSSFRSRRTSLILRMDFLLAGNGFSLLEGSLTKFADETGLSISVCHFPPGTSKWNKVEHRLFSFISSNWRAEPLRDYENIVRLIAGTTTATGLTVTCRLDRRKYPPGQKITDQEMAAIKIIPLRFHGEWNYTIHPRQHSDV